ncbi:helix-turn-helix domain-containing protein [Flavobacterium phycosphaerae]|uniref:helix-turn-helix domain-containing protein n=1 Tax=Flavobacterium phycosphaerae TaxID=2697515 RepID=UPI00138AADD3|nr:helix-turn-helix transcriptional regulator [Flavobacterium phycosphaerae]
MNTTIKPKHIGRNIGRIRELRGMKQEALAIAIGVTQQTISNIEKSETVEEEKLELIAKELGMTVEAIKNFSEENVVNFFNTFYDNSGTNSAFGNYNQNHFNFNPIEKLVESFEENKELYKALLQAEKDKVAYLEKLLNNK